MIPTAFFVGDRHGTHRWCKAGDGSSGTGVSPGGKTTDCSNIVGETGGSNPGGGTRALYGIQDGRRYENSPGL